MATVDVTFGVKIFMSPFSKIVSFFLETIIGLLLALKKVMKNLWRVKHVKILKGKSENRNRI